MSRVMYQVQDEGPANHGLCFDEHILIAGTDSEARGWVRLGYDKFTRLREVEHFENVLKTFCIHVGVGIISFPSDGHRNRVCI